MLHTFAAFVLSAAPPPPPFTSVFVPPFRGAPCTQFAGWESFTQPNNAPNSPDDLSTTDAGAAVWQLAAGGVLLPNGNLDNQTNPPVYRVTDSVPADLQEVVLQVSMNLNQIGLTNFTLSYTDAAGTLHTLLSPSTSYLLHLMGHDEIVASWDLSSVADTITSYRLDFPATQTFTTLDAVQLDARYACSTIAPFCSPGSAGVIACPCANPPAGPDRGCDNSSATGGAALSSSGNASLGADSLHLLTSGERATAVSVLLQGTSSAPTGIVFGQGVRCVAGVLKRLYLLAAVGGSITVPQVGDPSVSARSAALGDPISAGQQRYYTVYYRDPIVLGGCVPTSTFNATNALDATWIP
ncbi:MAG: hypothetical protein IPJ19_15660 [Planctomycetes bacterium]|nr:hypothetical protein [Planctomycetota bacterium]